MFEKINIWRIHIQKVFNYLQEQSWIDQEAHSTSNAELFEAFPLRIFPEKTKKKNEQVRYDRTALSEQCKIVEASGRYLIFIVYVLIMKQGKVWNGEP